MDDLSIFPDKTTEPTNNGLTEKLGSTFELWKQIHDAVLTKYPNGLPEWNFAGKKYGWIYRIKDKKRAIIYLLPRDKYFKVAFVFGQKAYDSILNSGISAEIKTELQQARKYAEGRGIRIDVKNNEIVSDIIKLIDIKLKY